MPQALARIVTTALLALAAAWGNAQTGDWGDVVIISSTVGNSPNRLCMGAPGDPYRPSDVGCPSYAPSLSTAGHVSVTGNVSAHKFIGDGSGLTNLNVQGDRIISNTHAAIFNENTGYISLTTSGGTWGYFSVGWSYLANFFTNTVSSSLVSATNVSATFVDTTRNGTVSGTYGYFRYISGTEIYGRFTGDGSGLTGVTAAASDRIISGTNASTRMVAISDTGYISITQAGANSGWFDPYRGLVTLGISATGPISGTNGYFTGNVGIGTAEPSKTLTVIGTAEATTYSLGSMPGGLISGNSTTMHIRTKNGTTTQGAGISLYNEDDSTSSNTVVLFGGGASNQALYVRNAGIALGRNGVSLAAMPAVSVTVHGELQVSATNITCNSTRRGAIRYTQTGSVLSYCDGTNFVTLSSNTTGESAFGDRIVSGSTNALAWHDRSLTISTAGYQRMIIGENGRVGIGTHLPTAPLEISDTVAKIKLNDTSGLFGGGLVLMNSGATNWTLGGGNDGVDQASFGYLDASNNLIMNLKQGGGVGVGGVVTPTATLQVSGSFTVSTSGQAATQPSLFVAANGKVGVGTTQTATSTFTVMSNERQLILTAPDLRKQLLLEYNTSSNTAAIGVEDGYSVADLVFRNNGAERMRLAANGRVGIATGNATPSTTLHVSGTIRIANSNEACDAHRAGAIRYTSSSTFQVCKGSEWLALLDAGSGGTSGDRIVSGTTNAIASQDRSLTISTNGIERVVVGENGWIGVNMTTPQAPLHISSSLGGMYLTRGGAVNEPYIVFQNGATGARQAQLRGVGDGGFRVTNGGASVSWLNILSTSEVGIGTSSPRATLQVSGTFTVSNSSQGSTSPSLVVAEDGNVGVGTAIPGNALHVAGNGLRLSGQYGRLIIEPSNFGTTETWNIDSSGGAMRFFSEPYATSGIPGGGSVRMAIVSPTGYIGMGTSTPRARLDVVGTISASNAIQLGQNTIACATGVSGSIRYSTTSNTIQFCNGAGWVSLASGSTSGMVTGTGSATTVAIWSGGSNLTYSDGFYWDDGNKRLGIGTNVPAFALDVRGPGHIGVSGSSAGLYFNDRSVGNGVSVLYRTGNKSYLYDNVRGNLVTLDNATGNFGIGLGGTIAPAATLQVSGTFTVSTSAQAATRPSIFVGEDGKVGVGTNNPQAQLDVTFRQDLGNVKGLVLSNASADWSVASKSVSLVFTRTPSGNIENHDYGEVRGGVESSDAAQGYLSFWSGGGANRSEKMRLMYNGRFGIGTTTPSATLHVAADVPRIVLTDNTTGASSRVDADTASGSMFIDADFNNVSANSLLGLGVDNVRTLYINQVSVGVGTAFPIATLQVSGTFTVSNSAQNTSPSLYVGTNGFVGIGTSNPAASLMVEGTTQTAAAFDTTGSKSGMIQILGGSAGVGSGGGILFGAFDDTFAAIRGRISNAGGNGTGKLSFSIRELISDNTLTERMVIAENGYVGIGTSSPAARLDVVSSTASVAVIRVQNGTGTCTYTPASSGTGTWACSSDARLKRDISDTKNGGLDYVKGFRIRDFTMKSDGSRQTGVVAQEVKKSHPGMVHQDEKGFYMVDEPSKWLMVKALQELKADNDNLRGDLEELRGELRALKRAVGAVEP